MLPRLFLAPAFLAASLAACGGSDLGSNDAGADSAKDVNDGGADAATDADDADSGCCPYSPEPNCCIQYGGWSGGGSCGTVCDGIPTPGPWWHLVADSHGCRVWEYTGAGGKMCGAPPAPDGGEAGIGEAGSGDSSAGEAGDASSASDSGTTSSLPPGAVAGTPVGVPASCTGDVYVAVPAADCAFIACKKPTVYALCVGSSFGACDCSIPPGYTPGP